uniref:Uncharacterized protein n=1 Tax=Steinernema glaseri TaxID=37863 RepID=A0A1I7Y0F5_9BILA
MCPKGFLAEGRARDFRVLGCPEGERQKSEVVSRNYGLRIIQKHLGRTSVNIQDTAVLLSGRAQLQWDEKSPRWPSEADRNRALTLAFLDASSFCWLKETPSLSDL